MGSVVISLGFVATAVALDALKRDHNGDH